MMGKIGNGFSSHSYVLILEGDWCMEEVWLDSSVIGVAFGDEGWLGIGGCFSQTTSHHSSL